MIVLVGYQYQRETLILSYFCPCNLSDELAVKNYLKMCYPSKEILRN